MAYFHKADFAVHTSNHLLNSEKKQLEFIFRLQMTIERNIGWESEQLDMNGLIGT